MYRERDHEFRTVVLLQTTREFASFRYELNVREETKDRAIHYRVTGLKAPQLSLPGSGPAYFRKEYCAMQGPLRISIEGLDHTTNAFDFEVSGQELRLIHSPANAFVTVTIEPLVRTDAP
jgi:hypothetical protein